MKDITLSVEHGSFAYKGSTHLLRDLSLTVSSGQILAVLGPNGVGKTTFLRCMMGLLPWSRGGTYLNGTDIRSLSPQRLWRHIAYVPQARTAFSAYTAEEMILLGRTGHTSLFSSPKRKDVLRVHALMEALHIEALAKKRCDEISGGELQMVLVARALAAEPDILVLDEPESNLDFRNQLIVLDTISRLAKEGMCCIFNTHYPVHALTRAGQALLLAKDGSWQFGPTGEIVTEEAIARTFGVRAVIHDVETKGNAYSTILPISLSDPRIPPASEHEDAPCIAVLAMLFSDNTLSERINDLLHEHRDMLIGRMGMPYTEEQDGRTVYIINVTVRAPYSRTASLTRTLSTLPGLNIKTTYYDPNEPYNHLGKEVHLHDKPRTDPCP